MTTQQRIELAQTWLRTCRENLLGPSKQWRWKEFDRFDRDLRLLRDFITDLEDELWPPTGLRAPEDGGESVP